MNECKRRSRISKLCFALIPLVVTGVLIEAVCQIYLHSRPSYHWHADRLENPAYTSRPWFSEAFLEASFRQPGGHFTPPGTRLVFPYDYQDQYFTIREHVRATKGVRRSSDAAKTIKLFAIGGSTTYCSEVPDHLTYPSQLQQRLAERSETEAVEVFNYGVTTVNSLQEVERLKSEISRGNIPDICLMLNGVNDVSQGIINANPRGTIFAAENEYKKRLLLWKIAKHCAALKLLAERIVAAKSRATPAHVRDEARLQQLARQTADRYRRNMLEAKAVCDQHDILMIVMLQPTLLSISGRELAEHERTVQRKYDRAGLGPAFEFTYPLLRAAISDLRNAGVFAFDITDAFNGNEEAIFLDVVHVNDVGNSILADVIFKNSFSLIVAQAQVSGRLAQYR